MPKAKKGFTLIEVILFLVIMVAIFSGVIGSIVNNVHSQRYKDTVNDFAEFLRRTYSEVANVQNVRLQAENMTSFCSIASMWNGGVLINNNIGSDSTDVNYPGRTDCALYGKLLTFGEYNEKTIHSYDVIGTIYNGKQHETMIDVGSRNSLIATKADVVGLRKMPNSAYCGLDTAGNSESYAPQWEGTIEDYSGNVKKAAVLIVRSPVSGTMETFYMEGETINVQETLAGTSQVTSCTSPTWSSSYQNMFLHGFLKNGKFDNPTDKPLYLCVNSDDTGSIRRAIQIDPTGNNSSAIEVADDDLSKEMCP
ncbi:MAG: type II secretion system protein [Candidatus Saccharibacteria bacterium]|nr:type II secretion system protein [Candidatus Saccharibacteria bacterium]